MYSALPIEMGAYGQPDQRRATDFAFLMPGVQGNNTTGNPTTNTGIVNGSGSRGAVSAVYIDGIPFVRAGGNGDPRYVWTAISVDAVDQFQVQTSGYSAIYEGQGIQNYTIKQGGNKYHGSVYEFFRNTALDTWGFFGADPNPATGVASQADRAQQRVRHQSQRPARSLRLVERQALLLRQLQRLPLFEPNPDNSSPSPRRPSRLVTSRRLVSGIGIYDPSTQAQCTANSTNGPCRYRYGYGPGSGDRSTQAIQSPTGAPVRRHSCERVLRGCAQAAELSSQRHRHSGDRTTTSPPTRPA